FLLTANTAPHTYIRAEHSLYPRRLELDASVGWELRELNYDRKIALSVPSRHVNEIDFCLGSSRGMPIASSARQKSLRKLPESLQRGSLLPCAIALNRCRDSCCAGCPIEVGQKALWRHMEHSAEGHGEGQASNKLAPQAGNRNDVPFRSS